MDGAEKPAGGGWMKIILGLSLAANLFFIGLMSGSLFEGKRERRSDPPSSFLDTLDDARKAEVTAYFKQMREDRKASRKKTQAAWAEVRKTMQADPYDRAALEAAMDEVMAARTERSEVRYAKMIDFVSAMSNEERVAFSTAMQERWKRRRERRKKRDNE